MPDTTSQSLSEAEIEALALEHEAFGFGRVDDHGCSTHGFDPEGLRAFATALLAKQREMDAKAEPTAFIERNIDGEEDLVWSCDEELDGLLYVYQPLFTHPPAAQDREPMTDEDAWEIAMRKCGLLHSDVLHMSRKQVVALAREVERFTVPQPTPQERQDAARLHTVLEVFGKREDNMPLTDAERRMLAAFDERGSYTARMKLSAIDEAMSKETQR